MPSENCMQSWGKRKWDNEEKDREEHAKQKRMEDADKSYKKACRCEQNRLAQIRQ